MLIELVDVLRCPRPHEETWLVASADRTERRRIVDGTLGCPICRAEYPIRGGVADFTGGAAPRASSGAAYVSPDDAMRLAALLDLTPGPGFALLFGSWGRYAAELTALTPVPLLLVNPPNDISATDVSVILAGDVLPLASGKARAAAIDPELGVPPAVAADKVRSCGRIVAPSSAHPIQGTREIARDSRAWVAERDAQPSAPVTLTARPR